MSNELEHAFAALSADAATARLEPASAIRRRGDRRTATRAVAGAAAVAVALAGVTIGAHAVLAGPGRPTPMPMPVPADSPAPAVNPTPPAEIPAPAESRNSTPPVKGQPPTQEQTTPANQIPSSIPASAFLLAGDAPGKAGQPERKGASDLPLFCDAYYEHSEKRAIQATQTLMYQGSDAPADSTPQAVVDETIMVFRGQGAEDFMDDLRAAVRACPRQDEERNILRGSAGTGDESMLIERNRPATRGDGEPMGDGSLYREYFVAIRVGDSIAFVDHNGWENWSAERSETQILAKRAGTRLVNWRQ